MYLILTIKTTSPNLHLFNKYLIIILVISNKNIILYNN